MKNEIVEKLKSDNDLLFSTLRDELIDYKIFDDITVFENEEDTLNSLEEWHGADFTNNFDNKRTEAYFTFNVDTKKVEYFDSLELALSKASDKIEDIAAFIIEHKLKDLEVMFEIEIEKRDL